MIRILLINKDTKTHHVLRMVMPRDFHLMSSYRGTHGVEVAAKEYPDLVLLDIDLPDRNGIEVLKHLTGLPAAPPVVVLTALTQIRLVVEAMQLGACDYVVRPFELQALMKRIKSYINRRSVVTDSMAEHRCFHSLIGESAAMIGVKKMLARYATADSPVLIYGESGTGKELAARIVHDLSRRASGPFVPRNCAAIPGPLFETELFGSERGAFTDAVSRPGSFELAHGGTLFLDEIGEIEKSIQAKLLRVLESSAVTRLGARRPYDVDLRIVSATNKILRDAVSAGSFREDLFYRINTLPVRLPPLRERSEDLPLLTAYFLRNTGLHVTTQAACKLKAYPWPGNIRELKNVLERAALLSDGEKIRGSDILFDGDM